MDKLILRNRFALEAIVIVSSILLAFAIDALWESRQERNRESELLASVLDDMSRNLDALNGHMSFNESADKAVARFINSTPESLSLISDRESAIDYLDARNRAPLFGILIGTSTFTPFAGSLSAANLADIKDIQIRNELGNWLGITADVVETTPRMYEISYNLKSKAAEFGAAVPQSEQRGLLPGDGPELQIDYGSILAALRKDESFVNAFLVFHNERKNSHRKMIPLVSLTESIISMLSEKLN